MNKNLNVSEGVREELVNVIKGIKMLSRIKKQIKKDLSKVINNNKVEEIFDGKITIDNLDSNDQYNFLEVIYNFTQDEKFNPKLMIESDNKEEIKGKEGKEELSKDEMPELYFDFDFKVKFANTYKNKDTRRVIMALFRRTAKFENKYNRDLYTFDIKELKEVFKSLKSKTIRSLQNTISTVERYTDFAIKKKRTENKLNYATAFDSKNKLEDLLDKEAEENMIFDRDEIMEIAMNSDNAQDGVIVGLLFDGLSHKNEFEELINLTKQDVDFENKLIKLEDRIIPMSHETKKLIEDALDQDRPYISIQGEKSRKYKIAEGEHVLRGLRGKTKVKPQIINQRLLRIKEIFGYPYLNATAISYSGQIDFAKTLINNDKLSIDDIVPKVLERFGIPVNDSSKFYIRTRIERYLNLK